MNKAELINTMSQKMENNKNVAEKALVAFMDTVTEEMVKGNKIHLVGFMNFEPVEVSERVCRNPKNGTTVIAPKHRKVKVKIGKTLKDAVM